MMKIIYSIVKSVRGLSHLKENNPNEDSVLLSRIGSHALVVAISDGHGSDKCFRSQTGSRFAVKALENIFQKTPSLKTIDEVRQVTESLPAMIVQQWKAFVDEDLKSYPYSLAEQSDECKSNLYLPYGCTLLGCYLTNQYGIFIQIGDGDMFALFSEGITKKLVPDDERLTGQETTSLCLTDAEKDFRISVIDFSENSLDVIILGTDGMGNSYSTDMDLFDWATDIKEIMSQENGRDMINENFSTWLDEVSTNGSGDDISMAVIVMEKDSSSESDTELQRGGLKNFFSRFLPQSKSVNKPINNLKNKYHETTRR